jgi:hypothetical protein
MTSSVRFEGEKTPEEYAPLVAEAMESARDELLRGRLFIPSALVQQCDSFFNGVFEGQQNFSMAYHPMVNPPNRGEFWKAAATVAYQHLPKILQQIEDAARAVIHGEPNI